MVLEIFIRYLHFLGILLTTAALVGEALLVKPRLTRKQINVLAKLDAMYGLSIILVMGMGISMWLWVGKSPDYYSDNPLFWTKFGLVGLLGILSAYPTVFFIRNRPGKAGETREMVSIPTLIKNLIIIELVLLLCIPVFAVLMARGVGL